MSTRIANETYYSVIELAELLNVTPQTIRKYIKEGKLEGLRIGRPTLIPERSLRNFLKLPLK